MMKMLAAIPTSKGTFDIGEVPMPVPAKSETLVEVHVCGICRSDFVSLRQPIAAGMAGFPGHEIVGRRVDNGQPVAVLQFPGRGYASFVSVPNNYLVPLPQSATDILPEPLACAVNILTRGMDELAARILIIGTGYMGCLLISLLRYLYPEVKIDAMDARASARSQALGAGAANALPATVANGKEATDGCGYPLVIEAAGLQETIDLATDLCTHKGRIVIAGYHEGSRLVNMQKWNWKGFEIINAHEREPMLYLEALKTGLRMVAGKQVMVPAISHRFRLSDIHEAFEITSRCPEGFTKACIDFTLK